MFQSTSGGSHFPADFNLPSYDDAAVRHILLGDPIAIANAIHRMASLGYCDVLAWSDPVPTGRNGECIRVMTRRRTLS